MKRLASILVVFLLLTGCGVNNAELDCAMALRAKMLASSGCSFDAKITADYGDNVYTFTVGIVADGKGDVTFTVKEPETISGITGSISGEGGKLTFDEQVLAFDLLADVQVTPVSAPWLLVRSLRSGYVRSCGKDGERIRLAVDDSFREDALHLDIWLGDADLPVYAEILYDDRRILSLDVTNFQFL